MLPSCCSPVAAPAPAPAPGAMRTLASIAPLSDPAGFDALLQQEVAGAAGASAHGAHGVWSMLDAVSRNGPPEPTAGAVSPLAAQDGAPGGSGAAAAAEAASGASLLAGPSEDGAPVRDGTADIAADIAAEPGLPLPLHADALASGPWSASGMLLSPVPGAGAAVPPAEGTPDGPASWGTRETPVPVLRVASAEPELPVTTAGGPSVAPHPRVAPHPPETFDPPETLASAGFAADQQRAPEAEVPPPQGSAGLGPAIMPLPPADAVAGSERDAAEAGPKAGPQGSPSQGFGPASLETEPTDPVPPATPVAAAVGGEHRGPASAALPNPAAADAPALSTATGTETERGGDTPRPVAAPAAVSAGMAVPESVTAPAGGVELVDGANAQVARSELAAPPAETRGEVPAPAEDQPEAGFASHRDVPAVLEPPARPAPVGAAPAEPGGTSTAGMGPGGFGEAPQSGAERVSGAPSYPRSAPSAYVTAPAQALRALGLQLAGTGEASRVSIAIRPGSLGLLEISAERGEDRLVRVAVLAERPETLQLLQRDAASLEAALLQAGIPAEDRHQLMLGLTDRESRDGRERDRPGETQRGGSAPSEAANGHPPAQRLAATGLLDLTI